METIQTGAVGRMIIDKEFLRLVDAAEGQIGVMPFGKDIIDLVKSFL